MRRTQSTRICKNVCLRLLYLYLGTIPPFVDNFHVQNLDTPSLRQLFTPILTDHPQNRDHFPSPPYPSKLKQESRRLINIIIISYNSYLVQVMFHYYHPRRRSPAHAAIMNASIELFSNRFSPRLEMSKGLPPPPPESD